MAEDKLYICLEAKGILHQSQSVSKKQKKKKKKKNQGNNNGNNNQYMILSVRLSDLTTQLPDAPQLKTEIVFDGPRSMGCGRFESNLVFAGGRFAKQNDFITFDLNTHTLSSNTFPPMQTPKVKPIVFELNKRLYVMDLSSGVRERAIEYFYPPENQWHQLPLPGQDFIIRHNLQAPKNSRNCSFVLMGNTCCFHTPPLPFAYFHHPNYIYNDWLPLNEIHPFSGVATCYRQEGCKDSMTISLDNGVVRAHQFVVHEGYWGNPIELFKITTSESNTDISSCFADFQGGIFSLSVSDKSCFHVYTFNFSIIGEESDRTMKVKSSLLSHYQIEYKHLLHETDVLGIVGCFASSPNHQTFKSADEAFNKYMRRYGWRCDDDPKMFEFEGERYPVPDEVIDGGCFDYYYGAFM